MFEFVANRRLAFLFTGFVIAACVVALVAPPRLPFGLEFSSGTSLTVEFEEPVALEDVRARLVEIERGDASVQALNDTTFFIRTEFVEEDLLTRLADAFGPLTPTGFERGTDMAETIRFVDTVAANDVLEAFGEEPAEGTRVEAAGADRFLVAAPGADEDRLAELTAAWESIGAATRTPFDENSFAEVLTFPEDAALTQGEVNSIVAGLGATGELTAIVEDSTTLFAAAPALDPAEVTGFVDTLTGRFGEAARSPVDLAQDPLFILEFAGTVTLEEVLEALVVLPVTAAAGSGVTVSQQEGGDFLLQGEDLAASADIVAADIESAVGAIEWRGFGGEDDLLFSLDLGTPVVTSFDFENEVRAQGRAELTSSQVSENRFGGVDAAITEEELADLIAGLELRFGLADVTTFDPADDLALALTFPEEADIDLDTLRAEISLLGLDEDVAAIETEGSFVLLGEGLSEETRQQVLDDLTNRFGEFVQEPVAVNPGAAFIADFGASYGPSDIEEAVAGASDGAAASAFRPFAGSYAVFGRDAADLNESIVAAVEEALGRAETGPIDPAEEGIFTVRLTDAEQSVQAVRNLLIIQQDAPNEFFIGGNRLSSDQQGLILSTLQSEFGEVTAAGLNFTTHVAQTLVFERPVSPEAVVNELDDVGYVDLTAEARGDGIFIRGSRAESDGRSVLLAALGSLADINTEAVDFTSVDAEIAKRSILNTFWAVLAGTVGILLYIWWAFRRIPRSYRYGFAAIVGLSHDVLIVLGVFGLLAKFTGVEVNSLMIVGILAVIGYSVNNTIVVFDRIRENVMKSPGRPFETSVNISLNETLTRNLNTTLTTAAAILAVLLFGGETIRDFMGVLLTGVIAGAYSSLMLAPNILVAAEKGELPRIRIPFRSRRAATA